MIKNAEWFSRFRCRVLRISIISFILLLFAVSIIAQEPPPRPLEVTTTQNISFGAFTIYGSTGTVTINTDGSRSFSGGVILLNFGYSYAVATYELVANPGTMISLLSWPSTTLTGSGGGTMTLNINSTFPATPFTMITTPPTPTILNVGGTLSVGSILANPAGDYTGTFNITFVQE